MGGDGEDDEPRKKKKKKKKKKDKHETSAVFSFFKIVPGFQQALKSRSVKLCLRVSTRLVLTGATSDNGYSISMNLSI